MPVQQQLQIRRDTAANWTSTNPTLASGEWGLETDTRQCKIGDGVTSWNSLGYQITPLLDETIPTDPNGSWFDGTGLVSIVPGSSNYASAPDSTALSITGDIDLRVKVSMDDWTAQSTVFGKWSNGTGQRSYRFYIQSSKFGLEWTTDGSTGLSASASTTFSYSAGTTKWLRVTLDVDNGATGRDITFYTSDDGTTWTQFGTTVTQAGTTSIFDSTTQLHTSSYAIGNGTQPFAGKLYRIQVLNGIGGTTAFDANFETVPADSFAFTESSANAATVTLTTTRYSFGLPGIGLLNTTTFALINNSTYYNYFRLVGKQITVKHIAFESTVAPATNATVRVAIYAADSMMQPTGAPLYDSGAVTVTSTGAAIYRVRVTPFTLFSGNYVLAFNTSVAFTIRTYTNYVWMSNGLGSQTIVFRRIPQTLTGAYPNPGLKWNTSSGASAPAYNYVLLGWS